MNKWFVVILLALPGIGICDKIDMGEADGWWRGVAIGAPRADTCVYAGNFTRYIYEFMWTDTGWVKNDSVYVKGHVQRITIGEGRNDGVQSIYAAIGDTSVYEIRWNGSSWDANRMGTIGTSYAIWGAAVGEGRNDGMNRVYAASYDNYIYEYTWNGSSWDIVVVGHSQLATGEPFYCVFLSKGRNDDTIRVYGSSQQDPGNWGVYEFTWDGSSWYRTEVGEISDMDDTFCCTVGPGRNDGINRVYAGGNGGTIYEFTWIGTWDRKAVDSGTTKWSLVVGKGTGNTYLYAGNYDHHLYEFTIPNDGIMRLYEGAHDSHVLMHTWTGSDWATDTVGEGIPAMDNAMWGIAIGNGRGPAAGVEEGSNYQLSIINYQLSIYPNPFTSKTVIRFQIPEPRHPTSYISLKIYDLTGRLVKTLIPYPLSA